MECSICRDSIAEGTGKTLSCSGCHTFHGTCIAEWWAAEMRKDASPTCPMCRVAFLGSRRPEKRLFVFKTGVVISAVLITFYMVLIGLLYMFASVYPTIMYLIDETGEAMDNLAYNCGDMYTMCRAVGLDSMREGTILCGDEGCRVSTWENLLEN